QNRFQIPKTVRWEYKLEPTQTMKITLKIYNLGFSESFLGKMLPAGRVTVPRIVIVQLQQILSNLKESLIEVVLEPI
ncbi:MAG: hypothetical protein ACXV2C_05190, partial [Candidatus Bathyarchaeia archaeon]